MYKSHYSDERGQRGVLEYRRNGTVPKQKTTYVPTIDLLLLIDPSGYHPMDMISTIDLFHLTPVLTIVSHCTPSVTFYTIDHLVTLQDSPEYQI